MDWFWINDAVTWFVDNVQTWQNSMREKKSIESSIQRGNDSKESFQNSLNTSDTNLKNSYNSMCNSINLSEAIVLAAQSHWVHDYDNLEPVAITDRFLEKNKWKGYEKYVNDCLSGKITLWDAVSKMKLNVVPKPSTDKKSRINPLNVQVESWVSGWNSNTLVNTAIWLWLGLGWLGLSESTYYWSKVSKAVWKAWMESLYKPTNEQKAYKQYLNAKIIEASDALDKAKASWDEKLIQDAEKALKNAKAKKSTLRTVADTAYDYWIWNPLNLSVTNGKEWDLALARANEIFNDVLNPIFEASDAKINVMDRVEELKDLIPSMTSDPWRQKDLTEAWAALLDEFRKKWYDSVDLKDVQKLKSDIQKRVPEKYWNWKNISSAYAEMKAELSRLIRKDLLNEVEKAIKEWKAPDLKWTRYEWKDIQTLYRDWGNLSEISDRSLKYKPSSIEIPWIGKIEWDVVTPAQKGSAYTLRKLWDYIENSKFSKAMKKINSVLWKFFKNKKVLWWLTVLWTIWSFADALEIGETTDFLGKFWDDLIRIVERYNKFWEFEGKTDEEIEEIFPESEVLDILKTIDNDKDADRFFEYFNEDLLWRKKVDMNKYWDYVWWRLKNNDEQPNEELSDLEKNLNKFKEEKWL